MTPAVTSNHIAGRQKDRKNQLGAQPEEQSVVRIDANLAQSVAQRLSVCFAR